LTERYVKSGRSAAKSNDGLGMNAGEHVDSFARTTEYMNLVDTVLLDSDNNTSDGEVLRAFS
jgi:hypothetical protein